MAIIKCPNNHFYDNEKYRECPHCRVMGAAGGEMADALRSDRTVAQRKQAVPPAPAPSTRGADDLDATISIFSRGQSKAAAGLPVGWLVCIDGPEKGREYRLLAGRNFAGKSAGMDICLSGDPEVDASGQFSVVFDPVSLSFSLVPGSGAITYLNDRAVSGAEALHDWDKLRAGNTTLMLRSFCGEEFQWQ